MTRKKSKTKEVKITLPYTLHEWSESLSYEEINDTLFVVDIVSDPKYLNAMSTADRKKIHEWLKKIDISKFLKSRDLAMKAYGEQIESEMFAESIIGMPYKRPMSH